MNSGDRLIERIVREFQKAGDETAVEEIENRLNVDRPSALELLKNLEANGAGRLVYGRRGAKTRLIWNHSVPIDASSQNRNLSLPASGARTFDADQVQMEEYSIRLRENVIGRLIVPIDITSEEADRMSKLVSALASQ